MIRSMLRFVLAVGMDLARPRVSPPRPKSVGPLRRELDRLDLLIMKDERILGEMSEHVRKVGGCCAGCAFGSQWKFHYEHLERRLARWNQLTAKLWRDAGAVGPLPPPRGSWEL